MSTSATPAVQALGLVASIALCLAAAGIGAAVAAPEIDGWYSELRKPTWTPPNWVFGPVWTILYLLMAISVWLVWRRGGFAGAYAALSIFGIQLVLNVLWSVVFFGWRRPDLALVEMVMLWAAIIATLCAFWPYSRTAAALLSPYLIWVTFALDLNFVIWLMQPLP
jgi:benzodiazapine receptor